MPALIDSMMYFGKTPWHGLGKQIPPESLYSIPDGLINSGLDWDVRTAPLCIQTKDELPKELAGKSVPNRATYRSTDNSILGVIGPNYTPLQNRDAFNWFQPFLDSKDAALHTAGALDGGKKVWILAQLGLDPIEVARGDEVFKFLLLSNSHDGTTAVRIGFTPVRVVCANTLAMAHTSDASKLIRIRHSKSVKDNVLEVRNTIDAVNQEFVATAEQYKLLSRRDINQRDLEKYVKQVLFPKMDETDELKTRGSNMIHDVQQRFETDKAKGRNWWTAYNAVNNWLNYERGRTNESRLNSLWFGDSQRMNDFALKTALELAV